MTSSGPGGSVGENLGCTWPLTVVVGAIAVWDIYYGATAAALWTAGAIGVVGWTIRSRVRHHIRRRRG